MGTTVSPPGPHGVRATLTAMRDLTSDPCPALDALALEYGPTFGVGGGPLRMVVVGDPAHLNPLLATSTDAFTWGHRFNVLGFIVGPGSMIVTDGDDHRRVRGAAQPGFARRRLDNWIPLVLHETDRLIDDTLLTTTRADDFYGHGRTLARRIVIRVLFGDGLGDRADELGARLEPAMEYGVQPGLRQLPHPFPYTRRARARQALRDADKVIYAEIDRRRRNPPKPDGARDVLDTLLAEEGDSISTTEVRDQTITLIAAGYDTTASALAWTVLRAASDADVWSRLRAEANEVFGTTPPADLDVTAFRDLKFADGVVRESLRLHPPGVFSPRQAARDLSLGEYGIRKGSMIMWSPYIAGRRPDVWDEPLTFRPDRFLDPDDRQRAAIDAAWMPFGKGPRACIGFALAQIELTLAIARLAQRTDIALTRTGVPKPVGMIVNRPEGGVIARVSAAS